MKICKTRKCWGEAPFRVQTAALIEERAGSSLVTIRAGILVHSDFFNPLRRSMCVRLSLTASANDLGESVPVEVEFLSKWRITVAKCEPQGSTRWPAAAVC